jgi:methylase of polypeptide subunit release factors
MNRVKMLMWDENRPETEAYTTHLAELLLNGRLHRDPDSRNFGFQNNDREQKLNRPLKILDLCSGSGCISLLLYSLLHKTFPNIRISGYDISEEAHQLSMENLQDAVKHHFHHSPIIEFRKINIFCKDLKDLWMIPRSKSVDIIISNPPYISREEFSKSTSRSVRNYEPKLALVPKSRGPGHDLVFFRRLLLLHQYFKSRVLVMETSGRNQCLQVAHEARTMSGEDNRIEIWRDWPGQDPLLEEVASLSEEHPRDRFPVRGSGSYRSVVLIRRDEPAYASPRKAARLQAKKPKVEREERKKMQRAFDRKWKRG